MNIHVFVSTVLELAVMWWLTIVLTTASVIWAKKGAGEEEYLESSGYLLGSSVLGGCSAFSMLRAIILMKTLVNFFAP